MTVEETAQRGRRLNRKVLIFGAVVVVPLIIFLASGFRFDPKSVESPLLGQDAPPFSLIDLEGQNVRLANLRGAPVVLNFWSSWCRPCVAEHGVLRAAAARYAGQVHFVGVIYHDEPEPIRAFIARRGQWGPVAMDPGSHVAIAYGVFGVPETFFIDRDGKVVDKIAGAVTRDRLTRQIEALLK